MAVILSLLIMGVSTLLLNQEQYTTDTRVFADIPDSPTPTIIIPGSLETTDMDSPDGTKTLTMEYQQTGDNVRYAFFISDSSDKRLLIYTKELDTLHSLSIPYNTWSPDNEYFFLKESSQPQHHYYVFSASGKPFSDASQFLSIQPLFEEQVDGYVITDVTGWAAPTLLLVNTQAQDEEAKVSFWFDVQSQSFIRLGTYFY